MFDRRTVLSTIAAATLAAFPLSGAGASPAYRVASFDIPAVEGAMTESRSSARSAGEVRRQGGFATAGSVLWLERAPEGDIHKAAIDVPGVIGAMHESRSLARSADEVGSQGGFATAGSVQWLASAPADLEFAAY